MESLIGANTDFQGELNVKGTLRVDGRIEGKLSADCVILSETVAVKGEIQARTISVGGKIEGKLRAQEIVEINSKGKVLGEIVTKIFVVFEGGEFNGKIEMKMDESEVSGSETKRREVDKGFEKEAKTA